MRFDVAFAAMMPASFATPSTSPFLTSLLCTALYASFVRCTTARAVADRTVLVFCETSTIAALPCWSTCVSVERPEIPDSRGDLMRSDDEEEDGMCKYLQNEDIPNEGITTLCVVRSRATSRAKASLQEEEERMNMSAMMIRDV